MITLKSKITLISSILSVCLISTSAKAAGRLIVYCSASNEMCEAVITAFGKKYEVKTSFIRNGSGATMAKIDAEKNNPQADVWYGGTLDPHSQAGEMGLLSAYKSPNLEQIIDKFRDPAKIKGNYSSVVYMGILGFGVNTKRLKEKGIETPKCWKDLIKPEFKDEIQIADPQSSGTAYTAIATFVQLWGEEDAFTYFKELNKNISQYTKSGITPSRNTARGESMIGIGFLHDYSLELENGAPIELIAPCEGTGYELGGVSIIKNARNLENAKLFTDFVLSKEGQETTWKLGKSYQILTNTTAEQSPVALNPNNINLINYDMDIYGGTEIRKRLINRWLNEVKLAK
ncbi:periplasmic-iron-binding protein [Gammaproteobacteria bacterium]|nr:periplasmic-iron-binding protein [Gammaproteobacteria bacterium]